MKLFSSPPGTVEQGKLVGQKAPFKLKEIWAIRVRLQRFRLLLGQHRGAIRNA